MGIFMDTLEDSSERIGIIWDATRCGIPSNRVIIPKLHYCPLCSAPCSTEDEVQDHLFIHHRNQQTYLKVNGMVVTSECYLQEEVSEITVHFEGSRFIEGSWLTGDKRGQFVVEYGQSHIIYPSGDIAEILEKIEIRIGQGMQAMTFTVHLVRNPGIRYKHLEDLFYRYQGDYVNHPDKFAWQNFRNEFQRMHLNSSEDRYISGLFDYLFSLSLESNNEEQYGKIMERAFHLLIPYPTLLAHTVKTTLAYKMNWYGRLASVPEISIFYPLGRFFNRHYDDLELLPNRPSLSVPLFGVHIDDFHSTYLNAVDAFYSNDMDMTGAYLEQLKKLRDKRNITQIEKLELIEGRYYRRLGEFKLARQAYGSMAYHDYFGAEVSGL